MPDKISNGVVDIKQDDDGLYFEYDSLDDETKKEMEEKYSRLLNQHQDCGVKE